MLLTSRSRLWILFLLFSGGLAGFYLYYPYEKIKVFNSISNYIESIGKYGPIILFFLEVAGVVLCFPLNIVFEMVSGYLYGIIRGALIISTSKTLGALISLLFAKSILKDWAIKQKKSSPKFTQIYSALSDDYIKLLLMLRLSPIPSWLCNYGIAIGPTDYKKFILVTFLAGIPSVFVNVHIGSFMNSIKSKKQSNISYTLQTLLLMLSILSSINVTWMVYKYVKKYMPENSTETSSALVV